MKNTIGTVTILGHEEKRSGGQYSLQLRICLQTGALGLGDGVRPVLGEAVDMLSKWGCSMTPLATGKLRELETQIGGGPLPLFYLILERARRGGFLCSTSKGWVTQQCGNALHAKCLFLMENKLEILLGLLQLYHTSKIWLFIMKPGGILQLYFTYNKVLPLRSLTVWNSSRNEIQQCYVIFHPVTSIKIKIGTFILHWSGLKWIYYCLERGVHLFLGSKEQWWEK